MRLLVLLALIGLLSLVLAQPAKIRGAALGGWLLMEKFITTSVMEGDDRIGDEWTFCFGGIQAERAAQ